MSAVTGNSLRRNFSSVLVGNSTYRLAQMLMIVVIARWGGVEMVGAYALAQAISAPIFLTLGLNLRVARATDVQRCWSSGQYHNLRLILNFLSISLSGLIAWFLPMSTNFVLVTLAVALSKASEASSHVTYGDFQLRERLDLMARSLLLRTVAGPLPFAVTLIETKNLALGCLALALGWISVTAIHDAPAEKRLERHDASRTSPANASILKLVKTALPLGVTAGITSLTQNVPRYVIQAVLGTTSLGLFAALAYVGRTITMITSSLADSLIGRIARTAQGNDPHGFKRNLTILSVFGALISIVVLLLAAIFGAHLTRAFLGPEYVNQPVLLLIIAGSAFVNFQRIIGKGLQGGRRFRDILVMDFVTALATVVAGLLMIPVWELVGAAATLGLGYAMGSFVGLYFLRRMMVTMGPHRASHKQEVQASYE